MSQTSDLNGYISAQDAKGFLRTYMELVSGGQNLSIPTGLEPQPAKEGWLQILPGIGGGYTDEFVDALTDFWLQTVKQQGGTLTETFAEEIVAIIDGRPKPKGKAAAASSDAPAAGGGDAPAPAGGGTAAVAQAAASAPGSSAVANSSQLDTVASDISSSYYKEQDARDTKPLSKAELDSQVQKALESERVDRFLIPYLSLSRHGIKPVVPKSSVITMIRSQWEEILLNEFHIMGSTEYIQKLSARWFYLVNQKGLPIGLNDFEALSFFIVANEKEEEGKKTATSQSTQPKARTGFMGKLKSLFGG